MGRVHYSRGEMEKAIGLFRQVVPVAQQSGDEELLSIPAGALGQTMAVLGHLNESADMLSKAASIFERLSNWTEWISAKAFLGTAVASMGRYREGLAHIYILASHLMSWLTLETAVISFLIVFWVLVI